jgi:hypothetical protein
MGLAEGERVSVRFRGNDHGVQAAWAGREWEGAMATGVVAERRDRGPYPLGALKHPPARLAPPGSLFALHAQSPHLCPSARSDSGCCSSDYVTGNMYSGFRRLL